MNNLIHKVVFISIIALCGIFCNTELPKTQLESIRESSEFNCLQTIHQEMVLRQLHNNNEGLIGQMLPCWSPGADMNDLITFYTKYSSSIPNSLSPNEKKTGPKRFEFDDSNRWSITATDGGGLGQGDPTTLTWSFVPDGTSIFGYNGEGTSNSSLISFLDGLYDNSSTGGSDLTQRAWFGFFTDIFTRWSQLTGNNYVYEPNDDGSAWTQFSIASGSLGVRGDLRISGHSIDGQSGSNILAYNFFPNYGDMVIDTDNTSFYGNANNNSLGLRNTLSHEHGHGLGISHSCPINQTKLMEPFISTSFDGPQFDDILAANRGYGDGQESNNNTASATDMGTVTEGSPLALSDVSIDDDSDTDFLKFAVTANTDVNVILSPAGSTYLAGPQVNSTCTAGSNFVSNSESNLSMTLFATNGTTVITTVDNTGAGADETITDESLINGAGTYYLRINGADNAAQLYNVTISVVNVDIPGCTNKYANNYDPSATIDNGLCTFDCNTVTTVIDNSNVNTVIITSMNTLQSLGSLVVTADTLHYQAEEAIIFNENFSVNLGTVLTVNIDTCSN